MSKKSFASLVRNRFVLRNKKSCVWPSLSASSSFAIKLMGVDGPKLLEADKDGHTQDFLFLSTNLFLTKDAKDFFDFVRSGALNYHISFADFFRIFGFLIMHPKVGPNLLKAQKKYPNLFEIEWFSATPYLFGERAVKYG